MTFHFLILEAPGGKAEGVPPELRRRYPIRCGGVETHENGKALKSELSQWAVN